MAIILMLLLNNLKRNKIWQIIGTTHPKRKRTNVLIVETLAMVDTAQVIVKKDMIQIIK
jgi:hypothetical protein